MNLVLSNRATRRTLESVRTTERLMEVLDEALAEEERVKSNSSVANPALMGKSAREHVWQAVNSLTAVTLQEVFLALPFSYALVMLRFFGCYFAAAAKLVAEGELVVGTTMPCRASVLLCQMHQPQLSASPEHRALLVQLKADMRAVLDHQRDTLGYGLAAAACLGREIAKSRVTMP